jgi:hypothetical protein
MELNMELLQPLDLINNCLITLPNTDTSFLNPTSINVAMNCASYMILSIVISLIALKLLFFKFVNLNINIIALSLFIGTTIGFLSFPYHLNNAMKPYQQALDIALPTVRTVNDPILNSVFVKGSYTLSEYGSLAKKYNERSEVIKSFAIKNSCK